MSQKIETNAPSGRPFHLGDWLVEPSLNRLSRRDSAIQLELKVMDVLVCLAEMGGEVLTRQEIVDRVWATEFISDNTLTHAITELRNALGDDARNPSFIETIHRCGYRLIAPVEPVVSDEVRESKVARFPDPERSVGLADDRSPYPGLAAFTEADAAFFFGREAEVARMWRKLTSRRLLAVIGPSGVGKSSFLRAGVIPARPEGWNAIICQPGEAPFRALARALFPEFIDDPDAGDLLVGPHDADALATLVARWRDRHSQSLLVVDQFEELVTLNPADVRTGFSSLLGRLASDVDVHVLLSMRDDFLHQCQPQAALAPIFEDLTPIGQPDGDALERALSAPAQTLGFRFDDDRLPQEMVAEVEGERGALPMLAFAVARLWEKRDRKEKLLIRQAYTDIGGVGGALARHAEETLKSVGDNRLPIVREVFRNLVTAQGTRAVRSADDLLSVFPEDWRDDATDVLHRLIDARLLTSFEEEDIDGDGCRRVEVVHESLLTSWPRLVRWQTQDADAAQLRDQIRQAAKTWDEHDRSDDLLWTGSVYREFAVWRERYPGGLSEVEEAFTVAMSHHARRRRRRRRVVVAAALALAAVLAAVFGTLWRHSVRQTRRAEAAVLLALGQLELDDYPTAALAYALASLEVHDTLETRHFELEALWRGPTATIMPIDPELGEVRGLDLSPDGRWLAASDFSENVYIWSAAGGEPVVLGDLGVPDTFREVKFSSDSSNLIAGTGGSIQIRSVPNWELIRELDFKRGFEVEEYRKNSFDVLDLELLTYTWTDHRYRVRLWPIAGGEPTELGWWSPTEEDASGFGVDPTGTWFGIRRGRGLYVRPVGPLGTSQNERLVGWHPRDIRWFEFDPTGDRLASADVSGEIRMWSIESLSGQPMRVLHGPEVPFWFDSSGSRLITFSAPERSARIWDLSGPPGARPVELRRGDAVEIASFMVQADFHPNGDWLAVANLDSVSFWPLNRSYSWVLDESTRGVMSLVFVGNDKWIASGLSDGAVHLWPLSPETASTDTLVFEEPGAVLGLAADREGQNLLIAHQNGHPGAVILLPLDGGDSVQKNLWPAGMGAVGPVAFSADDRLAAAGVIHALRPEELVIRVWDLETGRERVLDLRKYPSEGDADSLAGAVVRLRFTPDGHLLSAGYGGVRRWEIDQGTNEWLVKTENETVMVMDLSRDGRLLLTLEKPTMFSTEGIDLSLHDLENGRLTNIVTHGDQITAIALNQAGTAVITGDANGVIRVGPIAGGEPNLLYGHEGRITCVAISPDGSLIASAAQDRTVRIWPMPGLSKPPLHTLPHEELVAKLKTLTNLSVVRDEESSTGWKLEVGPFPGWETVPSW